MTQTGDQTSSNFDARADGAALALRKTMQGQGREVSDSSPVVVDANGKVPAALPPEGSYARQAVELERRKQSQQVEQPPAEPEPVQQQIEQQQPVEPVSPRAEQRIQELVSQLRERERQLQESMEMGRKATETASQYERRLQSLESQHKEMLEANLDNLDPDTRAQVMMDARMREQMDEFEQRILGRIAPKLQHLEGTAKQQEMHALSQRYQGFDYQTHAPLIDQFRARNPHCSIEQAFRAVAEPEELSPRATSRAQVVPPIVPPGNGDMGAARFANQQRQQQANPQEELVDESRRIAELRRSTDPAKQKEGMQLLDAHLKRRLS